MSTESIAAPAQQQPAAHCATCGAPMSADQRYCLNCGARRVGPSSILAGGPPRPAPSPPAPPPSPAADQSFSQRNPWLTLIAGIGVLLLAMGVGVLIGRSGSGGKAAAAPQVVTVAGAGAGSGSSSGGSEASFTSDWPSGKSGYTVEIQTLPTSASATEVSSAKTAATGKGAKSVGALKAEEFSSLSSSGYVIYSGVYTKSAEAQSALGALKKSFPSAKVVAVNNGSSSGSSEKEPSEAPSSGGNGGANLAHPAPPSVLEGLKSTKGKNYEEKSKNLPNVVSTG